MEWKRGAGSLMGGVDDGQTWLRALVEHERWLDLGDYLTGVSSVCVRMVLRGRTRDAQVLVRRGAEARLGAGAEAEGAGVRRGGGRHPGPARPAGGGGRRLEALRRFLDAQPRTTSPS